MDHTRRLRREQADAEGKIWSRLRNHQLGVKFRRQHRACGYILDFACTECMLAVELDGGQHSEQIDQDRQRTEALERVGWRVLRFWNNDALAQTDAVLDVIWKAVQEAPPHPSPLPRKRGRGGPSQSQSESQGRCEVQLTNESGRANDNDASFAPSPPLAGERAGVRGASDFQPTASLAALKLRAQLNALIRAFFAERGVLEVETPVLSIAGNTDPNIASFSLEFSGRIDGAPRRRWLRTSPEYALKRLLAAGVSDCYELGRVFRDGEAGGRHNPEFTMLEWYRTDWDHRQLIDETVALVSAALALVGRDAQVEKIAYRDLYRRHLDLDSATASESELRAALGEIEIAPEGLTRDDWLDLLMTHRIQPSFAADRLTAVCDYPASQCALARIRPGDPAVAERFELYLGPLELANGYHELSDPEEQRNRFQRDLAVRETRGAPAPPIDERLLAALEHGLPHCAGVALGVDRLLMAMLGTGRIGDVIALAFDRA